MTTLERFLYLSNEPNIFGPKVTALDRFHCSVILYTPELNFPGQSTS